MQYLPFEWKGTFTVKAIMTVQTINGYTDNKYNQHQNGILLSTRDHVLIFLNIDRVLIFLNPASCESNV